MINNNSNWSNPGGREDNPNVIEINDDDSLQVSELELSLGSFPAYAGTRAPSDYVPPASRAAANRMNQHQE